MKNENKQLPKMRQELIETNYTAYELQRLYIKISVVRNLVKDNVNQCDNSSETTNLRKIKKITRY